MKRFVVMLMAALLSWSGAVQPSAAVPVAAATVVAHTYDAQHRGVVASHAPTGRGPPADSVQDRRAIAVGLESRCAAARFGATTLSASLACDGHDLLERDASVTDPIDARTTEGLAGAVLLSGLRGVAANAGVRTCLNSFTAETLVLMADGSRKSIKDVKLGDKVMATDPETGETGPRKVVDLIRHGGLHTMVAVWVSDGSMLDATDHHPFWVESQNAWVDAIELQSGDVVVTADGERLTVTNLGISQQGLTAYNLTVAGLPTYFVGDETVLVHNTVCPTGLRGASDGLSSVFGGGSVRGRSIADIRSGLLDNGFTQGLANNKSGYRFVNSTGEEVRIRSRGGQWDIRVRNADGNSLDEFGNVAPDRAGSHEIFVYSR